MFTFCFVHLLRKKRHRTPDAAGSPLRGGAIAPTRQKPYDVKAKILNASAGSGKTYQLAYKYVHDVIERPELYRHILAVTFTNKATEEMKSRILKEIHKLASGAESPYLADICEELRLDEATVRKRAAEARAKILHDYSRFTVLTIDTFFQRILRAFIQELGLDLNYNIELETASVLSKGADAMIEQITVDRELLRWMTDFVQERIDDYHKWDLRKDILALGNEIFKEQNKPTLASMQSKKELERLVNEIHASAEAAKRRYRELAQQMLDTIGSLGLSAEDFKNGYPVKFLQKVAVGSLEAYPKTIQNQLQTTESWGRKGSSVLLHVPQLQPMLRAVCSYYDEHLSLWNTAPALRREFRSFALLADLYGKVQQLCSEQNLMLLSETKNILAEFIAHNDAPFIYEKVGNRFERFMIDEFQDTSGREWENFLPLLQNALAQVEQTSVLIVGDIKQSIYRWRGGDWKILHEKAREALGPAQTKVETLKENFRSLPVIVRFNNEAIDEVVKADNQALNALVAEAEQAHALTAEQAAELRDTLKNAYANHTQIPRRSKEYDGYVSVERFEEHPPVVERICELIDKGFRPCDILILVRQTSDGCRIAEELLAFKRTNTDERYRFEVMTREALLLGAAPVSSFVVAVLHLALNSDDSIHRACYNRFLERRFDAPLSDDERLFFRSLRLLSPEDAFERIVMRYALQHAEAHTAYLQAIHERLIAFCAGRIADIPLFLRWWEEQGAKQSLAIEHSDHAVEIMTVHKAKGLERKAVIIPYCTWDLNPLSGMRNIVWAEPSGDAAAIGRFPVQYLSDLAHSAFSAEYFREKVYAHVDNINLLYVALTRAAESLHIFIDTGGTKSHVGKLLWSVLAGEGAETQQRLEYGTFTGPVASEESAEQRQHVVLREYPTAPSQLKLRLPSQRYFEEGERDLSPRNLGILMHKAFQQAATEADIRRSVEQMQADALLSEAAAGELLRNIDAVFEAYPAARSWFDGSWECVRNEHAIILPAGDAAGLSDDELTRRPDRVMLKGDRAVVVDYKFGRRTGEEATYRRQIRRYLELIRCMGYASCEGYLWYVRQGEIERVELG